MSCITTAIIRTIFCEVQYLLICRVGQVGNRLASKNMYKYLLNRLQREFAKLETGEIQNMISRKGQAVQDIINTLILNLFPTVIILILISIQVVKNLGFTALIITNCSVILYIAITIKMTIWRNKIRARVNKASNLASDVVFDGLLNFENIFIGHRKDYEVQRYDC